jgi:hypothetical protein
MAHTLENIDGAGSAVPVRVLGSFVPMSVVKVNISGTTTSETITLAQYGRIFAVIPTVYSSGNNIATTDIDVVISGNTITLSDGSTFNLDAAGQSIYLLVFGAPKLA